MFNEPCFINKNQGNQCDLDLFLNQMIVSCSPVFNNLQFEDPLMATSDFKKP